MQEGDEEDDQNLLKLFVLGICSFFVFSSLIFTVNFLLTFLIRKALFIRISHLLNNHESNLLGTLKTR